MLRKAPVLLVIGMAMSLSAVARAGVDPDLVFQRITQKQAATVTVGDLSVPLAGEAQVLLVRRADPTTIKDGEWVSVVKEPGDGAPLWLFIGEDSKQVQRLIETAEVMSPEAKKVGGLGTCSLYTPCRKCRAGFEETVSRRKLHPIAVRVQAITADKLRAGSLLATADIASKRRPLLVFENERAGEALNRIRSLAARSNRLAQ